MTQLTETRIECPYCGEPMVVLLDAQEADQEYIEDCQICCRPITFLIAFATDGELSVSVRSEDEAF